jgi:hypothetical protein
MKKFIIIIIIHLHPSSWKTLTGDHFPLYNYE